MRAPSTGFLDNLRALGCNLRGSIFRHGPPTSGRSRAQAVFSNLFLHVHATHVHPRSLTLRATAGLGVSLAAQFAILTVTGILLMLYYQPSVAGAYDSMKDIVYVVPTGRYLRNIHRWAAHLMVFFVFLHMARVFYTAAYKRPREFNWVLGMLLFVLTLALSFTGYLLPWDQLAYWATTIGANIAASPDELTDALGLTGLNLGQLQKEALLGSSVIGQDALTRFYILHVMVLPLIALLVMAVHVWRIRKDGGLARPQEAPSAAGASEATSAAPAAEAAPSRTYGLMAVVKDRSPYSAGTPDETVSAWPFLLRAELLVLMVNLLACLALAMLADAPLKEPANALIPENPAKAPWYFLGLQEMVSYSAFVGGILVPTIVVIGLAFIPYLDREDEAPGRWFSGSRGRRVSLMSLFVGATLAVASVAVPVRYGWLRNWFPDIPQIWIILCNPGSLLAVAYVVYALVVLRRTRSTRLSAVALFTCFLVGFAILTYVGTYLRGPNWDFFWSEAQWPAH